MTDPSVPAPSTSSPRATPTRVITVGGGRGGVGKSVLAVNLAVYLAQLGRSVVLADLDPVGSRLHTLFGLKPVAAAREPSEPGKPALVATPIPGLFLLPPVRDSAVSSILIGTSTTQARRLELRDLGSDYVLLDIGSGAHGAGLDLFLAADVGVCVTAPEPPAIETTYNFLRALFLRRLRRVLAKDKFKIRTLDRAVRSLLPFPNPPQVVEALGRQDPLLARRASAILQALRPRLAVCQTRVRGDLDLGSAMRSLALRHLGMDLDYLGYVEHDDAVWLTVRRGRPLLVDNPTSKSARNLERIARRVLALAAARDPLLTDSKISRASVAVAPQGADGAAAFDAGKAPLDFYELLGIQRGSSDEEVRRAYKRQRDIYAEGAIALTSLLPGGDLELEQTRLQEAHDTLLDPNRRRAYDLSAFGEEPAGAAPSEVHRVEGADEELAMLQAELAREVHAQTEFTGTLLRKVRESLGVELADIAATTKISTAHLRAIEEEAFGDLPALVYTRGFVQELAKYLRLDPAQVTRTYLKRMRDGLSVPGGDT